MSFRRLGNSLGAIFLLLILTTFNVTAESDYHFDMGNVFGITGQNATNRTIQLQSLSPFQGNFFYLTSSVSGDFWLSNAISFPVIGNTYSGIIKAPPSSITFSVWVPSTNLGSVEAQGYTSIPANGVQTFPAGATAPSWQAALQTFALGTNGPTAGINASQATNIAKFLINLTNASYSGIQYTGLTQILYTNALPLLTNGFVDKSITNNAPTYSFLNIVSNFLQSQIVVGGISAATATNISAFQAALATNGIGIASGLSAFVSTNRWDTNAAGTQAANLATNAIGIPSGLMAFTSTNRWDTNNSGIQAATAATNGIGIPTTLSAFVPTNRFAAQADWIAGSNFLQSQIVGGSITAAGVTNISSFLIGVSNAPLSTSNSLLFVAKVDSTNGFSTGERATNLNIAGSLGLGATGLATNIISGGTNLVKFINAGSAIATNGVFIWTPSLGCYTNWITSAIWTNTGSGWVMATNAVNLYSLSGASPFGLSSTVSGSAPAPLAVPTFYLDHNGMQDVGFFSVTNLQNFITNIVNAGGSNAIANLNGLGTNTYLTNPIVVWNMAFALNLANNGGVLNFQAMSAGVANTNTSSGGGAAILSGATNKIAGSGSSVVAGGAWNWISAGANNWDFIGAGISNVITGVDGSFLGGGFQNQISQYFTVIAGGQLNLNNSTWGSTIGGLRNTNSATGGVILGGTSNAVFGAWTAAGGRNAKLSNENSFGWSDGTLLNGTTNSQFLIAMTNGVGINTNITGTNALAVGGNIDALSMSLQGTNILNIFNSSSSSIVTASNFLALTKLNITNDTSYGQTASNLTLRGRTAFNQATNFFDSTNVIKFYQAGTSFVTNGTYEWINASASYTNRFTTAIITNTGSQWILITNGAGIYSSATLINAAWGAISGSGTASSCYGYIHSGNGELLTGIVSSTNLTDRFITQPQLQSSLASGTNSYNGTNVVLTGFISINGNPASDGPFILFATNSLDVLEIANPASGTALSIEVPGSKILAHSPFAFAGSASGISNVVSSGISTNGSTIGQVLANVGSGRVGWTNQSGGGGGSQTPITQDVDWATFAALNMGALKVNGGITNSSLTASTVLEADANKKIVSLPNAGGVLTNNSSGGAGYSSAFTGTWIQNATLPFSAADSSWYSLTNVVGWTNQPTFTVGNAVVITGTNAQGVLMLKATNWPSGGGGGSQTPWTSDIDGAHFALTNVNAIQITNITGLFQIYSNQQLLASNVQTTTYARLSTNETWHMGSNSVDTITMKGIDGSIVASNITATTFTANGGPVSYIPTNGAPVQLITLSSGTSLPVGITNLSGQRTQPVVQWLYIGAITGLATMTCSNESTGMKLTIREGAIVDAATNWFTLPITTTNQIWRLRDESTGTGAAVGVITNWFMGL